MHTNFAHLLRAEQRALLQGKPLHKASGQASVRWDVKVDRADVVRSLLVACSRATKKTLLCKPRQRERETERERERERETEKQKNRDRKTDLGRSSECPSTSCLCVRLSC